MSTIAGMSFASRPGPPRRPRRHRWPRPRGDRPTDQPGRPTTVHRVVILTLDDGCAAPRVPVLACRDALRAAGAQASLVTAGSDAEIDAALAGDGARLIVAAAADGQVRAVVRRLVRRHAP